MHLYAVDLVVINDGFSIKKKVENWHLNRENTGSNPVADVSNLWQFRLSYVDIVHSAV